MSDLIVITGQTATGKTKLALDYAKKLNGELISADSRQVYKYLDIITGKDKETLKKRNVPIHLIDVVAPDHTFSSFDFATLAPKIMDEVKVRGKTPILVGGTYLYIKHLLYGQDVSIPPDTKLREELEGRSVKQLQENLLQLFKQLKYENTMNKSDWNNPRRLMRKIEILSATGKSAASEASCRSDVRKMSDQVKIIGLKHKDRESLLRAITERVEKRLAQGALGEVQHLLEIGYKKTDHGLQTIGYKQLISHIEGDYTLEQAKTEWINKEVQYAKRQYTFMKTNPDIIWGTV